MGHDLPEPLIAGLVHDITTHCQQADA